MGKTVQLALAGLSAVAVAFGFARYGYGLFVPVFREEFGLSTETVGLVSSAGYAAYLPAMAATGFLSWRVGPRFQVVAGALCAGLGMLLIATAWGLLPLVAGVLLAGTSPALCVAPFADAVAMLVKEERRDRVLSTVSTGTTLGLAAAAPVVLLTATGDSAGGPGWRYAWASFAAAALLVAFCNARLLPNEPYREATAGAEGRAGTGVGWFLRHGSVLLLGQAAVYGLTGAFYYTYAVDLVRRSGLGESWGPILWGLVGLAGATGAWRPACASSPSPSGPSASRGAPASSSRPAPRRSGQATSPLRPSWWSGAATSSARGRPPAWTSAAPGGNGPVGQTSSVGRGQLCDDRLPPHGGGVPAHGLRPANGRGPERGALAAVAAAVARDFWRGADRPVALLFVPAAVAGKAAGTVLFGKASERVFRAAAVGTVLLIAALGVATDLKAML